MDEQASEFAPVTQGARIESLDVLRGVAVFGILAMNITAFGLVWQAYGNPTVAGGATGWDLKAYEIVNVGFEGTMRGIFSLLFGASIVLLTGRMEEAGAGIGAAEIHFRRMLWMMLFGIIHWTLMLWVGEILFAYSLCGLVLFSFRKLDPKPLLAIGGALLLLSALFSWSGHFDTVQQSEAAAAAEAAKAGGAALTDEQEEAIAGWGKILSHTEANPENIAEQRAWHEGSYVEAVTGQFDFAFQFQWVGLPFFFIFDMVPFMLIGMALLKLGIITAERSMGTYAAMAVAGYAIGLPIGLYELSLVKAANFGPLGFSAANATYEISRLAMVIGHLGVLLLVIKTGVPGLLLKSLGAVGQMALSNYLSQTIICTMLFYGFGFGLWNELSRWQLYIVVFAIWAVQLVWSPLWLSAFRFGPFEWLWRSLTYWKLQPMRRRATAAPAGEAALTPG